VKPDSPREAIIGIRLFMYKDGTKVKTHAVKARSRLRMEIPR
jgi:hypothetical protein